MKQYQCKLFYQKLISIEVKYYGPQVKGKIKANYDMIHLIQVQHNTKKILISLQKNIEFEQDLPLRGNK